jgi:hypothetical protein
MILKAGVSVGAVVPVIIHAAASAQGATIANAEPVVWHLLGYAFEAGSMIAALCACVAARVYVTFKTHKVPRWALDVPVMVLVSMFTAATVAAWRPTPLIALMVGTGFGAIGAGVIAGSASWLRKKFPELFGEDDPSA